jgi:hypothetical protein
MYYSPQGAYTLLSQGQLARKGFEFRSKEMKVQILKEEKLLMEEHIQNDFFDLYQLDISLVRVSKERALAYLRKQEVSLIDRSIRDLVVKYHNRLCHVNLKDLRISSTLISVLEDIQVFPVKEVHCNTCLETKPLRTVKLNKNSARSPQGSEKKQEHPRNDGRDTVVYTDMAGPFKPSYKGNRYLKVNFASNVVFSPVW